MEVHSRDDLTRNGVPGRARVRDRRVRRQRAVRGIGIARTSSYEGNCAAGASEPVTLAAGVPAPFVAELRAMRAEMLERQGWAPDLGDLDAVQPNSRGLPTRRSRSRRKRRKRDFRQRPTTAVSSFPRLRGRPRRQWGSG